MITTIIVIAIVLTILVTTWAARKLLQMFRS